MGGIIAKVGVQYDMAQENSQNSMDNTTRISGQSENNVN
jgi:hypothetical protein